MKAPSPSQPFLCLCNSFAPSNATASLLSRPPRFVPTPTKSPHAAIRFFINDLIRKVQWRSILHDRSKPSRFTTRTFRPPPTASIDPNLLRRCNKLREAVNSCLSSCSACFPRTNLNIDEVTELERLRSDPSLTVAPADKGGKWVILSAPNYIAEAERQLSNETRYTPTNSNVDLFTKQRLEALLLKLRRSGFISNREWKALLPPKPFQQRRFFALPKIHKDSWPGPEKPPLRPIVSDVNSVSRACASLIEHFLAPIAQSSSSYLRDSQHLLALLCDFRLFSPSLFLTMDVTDLYNNIPIAEGIAAVSRAFLQHPDPRRPDLTLLSMLHLLLTRNCFSFNGRQYLQLQGTPMGAAFSGSLANIYMTEWETKCLNLTPCPRFWGRFIDDIFGIWDLDSDSLRAFHSLINTIDPNIQVSLAFNAQSIRFLDLELYRTAQLTIGYRIGFKPTDSHLILPPDSHHPKHVFRGVLLGQVLRWASKSSTYEDFRRTKATVFPYWKRQGYSRAALRQAVATAFQRTRQQPSAWTPGFYPCANNCNVCQHGLPTRRFTDTQTNNAYILFHRLFCDDPNTVYIVSCSSCSKQYVGQTSRPLRRRIAEHLSDIVASRNTPVGLHFTTCGLQNFFFFAIERVPDQARRLQREASWIERLHTLQPHGINRVEQSAPPPPVLVLPHSLCGDKIANLAKATLGDVTALTCTKRRSRNLLSALRTL